MSVAKLIEKLQSYCLWFSISHKERVNLFQILLIFFGIICLVRPQNFPKN